MVTMTLSVSRDLAFSTNNGQLEAGSITNDSSYLLMTPPAHV